MGHATIASMQQGHHHLHIRKRMYKNLEKFPHPRGWVRTLDYIVYTAGFLGPAMTIPQVVLIYATHDAGNVSALSWGAYALFDIPWVLYGIVHKEPLITFTYILWFIANMLVTVGALVYGTGVLI